MSDENSPRGTIIGFVIAGVVALALMALFRLIMGSLGF